MASRSDTELLTEHFGYPPVSLLDEIINSVNFLAERALHSIEQGLLNAPPASLGFRPRSKAGRGAAPRRLNGTTRTGGVNEGGSDAERDGYGADLGDDGTDDDGDDPARRHRDEVEAGTHQLETLLWASIDKNFDRFEIYVMRNILCLRPEEMGWMRLGHYEGLDFDTAVAAAERRRERQQQQQERRRRRQRQDQAQQQNGEMPTAAGADETSGDEDDGLVEDDPTVESVNKLRRRLQASQRLNCMLVAERARNAALLGEMRRLVGVLPGKQQQQPKSGGIKTEAGASGAGSSTANVAPLVTAPNSTPTPTHGPDDGQGNTTTSTTPPTTNPPFAFLHDKGDLPVGDGDTPLTTTTDFTLSQLQALRELSAALRAVLPTLAAGSDDNESSEDESSEGGDGQQQKEKKKEEKKKSWRLERLEYVETATRKHIERARGLEQLGGAGPGAGAGEGEVEGDFGADWAGGGRRLAAGEVESLERVVAVLAEGEPGDGDKMDES